MDLGFLEKFTGGDMVLTRQLIETFLQDVPKAIEKLEEFIPKKNWKEVHAVSHKIKSCVAIFELNDLKVMIMLMEANSRDHVAVDKLPELFIEFKRGCNEAIINLQTELKKLNELQM